jgi:hypothetical protein
MLVVDPRLKKERAASLIPIYNISALIKGETTTGSWPETKLINPKLSYRQMSTELAPQIEPFKCRNL